MEIPLNPLDPSFFVRPITLAFYELLNEKHLYQHVDVNWDGVLPNFEKEQLRYGEARRIVDTGWGIVDGVTLEVPRAQTLISVRLPLVKTYCTECKEVYPFNLDGSPGAYAFARAVQIFVLPFQCQGCRKKRVVFMVTRDGDRLTLSGRSEIEQTRTPDYIPRDQRRYYSGAVLAFNCNQILPALFLLRTLIEQYMRSVVPSDADISTGDRLCAEYNKTLDVFDPVFKSRFPSFSDIYGRLSDALHRADENVDLFKGTLERIESHFEGKRSFERAAKANQ